MIRNRILSFLILLLLPALLQAQTPTYQAGRDYTLIESPPPDRTPDTIKVLEYFWYGCPGCYAFEPRLEAWKDGLPEHVEFSRLPALWSDWHKVHARAYYIAQQMERLDTLHPALFHAMHRDGLKLRDRAELRDFFADQGIAGDAFDTAYDAFSTNTSINRADQQARQYAVRATPSLVVNGRYLVPASNQALDIVDFLIARETAASK